MPDSYEGQKGGIPSWQRKTPVDSKENRITQAKRFLEADQVRDASAAKKIAFLESKGYSRDEVIGLVEEEDRPDSKPSQSKESITKPDSLGHSTCQHQQKISTLQQDQSQTPSTASPTSPHISVSETAQATQQSQPPIITYPEFLTKPSAPSPLITSTRLLTTLTLFSSISTLLYGSNKYILVPMQESLTRSRHELLELASKHLSTLNAKLGGAVSEQPIRASPFNDIEDDESDGDPTELFHRDVGNQTSPSLNASPSRPSLPSSISTPTKSPLESQLGRLSTLKSDLSELYDDSTTEGSDAAQLTTTIDVLRDYLESMAFTPPPYTFGGSAYSGMVRDAIGGSKEEPDEIAKLKASIRSVKGVLLSARSFPSGGRMMSNGMGAAGAR